MAGSLTDIFAAMQNGVVALGNLKKQMIGSFTNISAQLAAINAATYVNSFKARTGVVVPVQGDYPTSLIPGTATNDNATAGNIGEYAEAVIPLATPTALTSSVAVSLTSFSLTAGDWDISSIGYFSPTGTTAVQFLTVGWSLTNNTLDTTPGRFNQNGYSSLVTGGPYMAAPLPAGRLSIAATTTVYMIVQAFFTVSTLTGWGIIDARRVR